MRNKFRDVSLEEILIARESRVQFYTELIKIFNSIVVVVTLNIPGAIKNSSQIESFFNSAFSELKRSIEKQGWAIKHKRVKSLVTGQEGYFVVTGCNSYSVKNWGIKMEELLPYGRLLDIDIVNTEGNQLERKRKRKCFLCDNLASICRRLQNHSPDEINKFVETIINTMFD